MTGLKLQVRFLRIFPEQLKVSRLEIFQQDSILRYYIPGWGVGNEGYASSMKVSCAEAPKYTDAKISFGDNAVNVN